VDCKRFCKRSSQSDVNQTDGWEVEAQAAVQEFLARYDKRTDSWDLPREGRLWSAVQLAHLQGHLGAGRKAAIIDGSVDLSIPRLAERVKAHPIAEGVSDEPRDHASAVALLLSEVAPEAEIDLYEVFRDGRPQRESIASALALVAETDADIVNMSLGRPTIADHFWPAGPSHLNVSLDHPLGAPLDDDCELCAGTNAIAKQGKIVVAAAGNRPDAIYCPARSSSIISCGFSIEERWLADDGGEFAASHTSTAFPQAIYADFPILQVAGALGTSFAAPLLSGFLLLVTQPEIVSQFIISAQRAAKAELFHQRAREGDFTEDDGVLSMFERAMQACPHHHVAQHAVAPCPECMLFSEDLYVNYGLALIERGRLGEGQELLAAAAVHMPLSPHANANLGWLRHQDALAMLRASPHENASTAADTLARSRTYLDRAIELRDFPPYRRLREHGLQLEQKLRDDLRAIARIRSRLDKAPRTLSGGEAGEVMEDLSALDPVIMPPSLRGLVTRFLAELRTGRASDSLSIGGKYDIEAFQEAWSSDKPDPGPDAASGVRQPEEFNGDVRD
jgi:Subtilase family